MSSLPLRLAAFAVASVIAAPASAGWASLGAMPAPRRKANALVFQNAQGTVVVAALAPDVVRVRFSIAFQVAIEP